MTTAQDEARNKGAVTALTLYFAILGGLTLISFIPGAIVMGLFLFIVPGLILLAASTVLYYSVLLLLPLYALWPLIRRHPVLIVLVAIPPLVGGVALPLLSQVRLRAFVAEQTRNDFDRWQNIPIKTVALGSNAHDWSSYRGRVRLTCPDSCQRLLFNHEVDKVVMVTWGTRPSNDPPATTAYWIEQRASCDPLYTGQADPLKPEVKVRIAAGECLVAQDGADLNAVDATAAEDRLYTGNPYWDAVKEPLPETNKALVTVTSIGTLRAFAGGLKTGTERLHQTVIEAGAFRLPLFFFANGNGLDLKLGIARTKETFNGGNIDTLLRSKFGFKLDPVPPSDQELPLARKLIASSPEEKPTLTHEDISFLQNAMNKLGRQKLESGDVELIRTLVRDRRFNSNFAVSGVFYQHAEELQSLLPDFLDRLAADDIARSEIRDVLNYGMTRFHVATLAPHAARMREIAQRGVDNPGLAAVLFGVIWRLGDVGPESAPLLQALLAAPDSRARHSAANALCRLGSPAADIAIPALRNLLSERKINYPSDETRAIVRTLIRLGDKETASSLVAANIGQPQNLKYDLALEVGFPIKECERFQSFAD